MIVVWSVATLLVGTALGVAIGRRRDARTARHAVDPDQHVDAPISQRVDRTDEALRQAIDRLELSVVICDSNARVIYRNRPATAMRGTHAGVIIEGHLEDALDKALASGHVDKRIELHGPPRVALELRAERLANGHAVAMVEDVSERARIDAMRTDFVANISHELKTPVGAIAVLAETLEGEDDLAIVARVSERLVNESHRAVTTIDDLLELSRIESSRAVDEVVDVSEIVQHSLARGRDVDPTVDLTAIDSGETIRIRADRRQLTSAIGNLVENAVKYSDPGCVVQIRTLVGERFIEIMVSDQGHGIPQRDLDRIFERFYRVDRARSRETGGTGLGLSIVRHVAHNHGGDVVVSSQEGEGSTFVFRLPISLRVPAAVPGEDPEEVQGEGRRSADLDAETSVMEET
jgi:two-component system, OmpR family, sensor histidine kinase SenX3